MIILAWNCRGIGHPAAIWTLRVFINTHKLNVLFLSELHTSSPAKIQKLILSIDFPKFELVSYVGCASGRLLCWKSNIDMRIVSANRNIISGIIFSNLPQVQWCLNVVYGPINPSLKPVFWDQLLDIVTNWSGPRLILGNFNTILNQQDKLGSRPVAQPSNCGFVDLIRTGGLIDVGFKGNRYTWTNRWCGQANIHERIDRGFINDSWRLLFPHSLLTHLPVMNSDHRPILLNTTPIHNSSPKPFCFESMWIQDPTAADVIHAWNASINGSPR